MRTRYGLALVLVVLLALGACATTRSATAQCALRKSNQVPVGGSRGTWVQLSVGATLVFNERGWKLASWDGTLPDRNLNVVVLHGTMTLRRSDVSVFRSDDGRTFTFGPNVGVCS